MTFRLMTIAELLKLLKTFRHKKAYLYITKFIVGVSHFIQEQHYNT
ncbi:hypothetical protein [Winogradskyella sp.]